MSELVLIEKRDGAGIIRLNRPKAINALNSEMIGAIADALKAWRRDKSVRLVVIEGEGERGFCAGGDVRAIRALVQAGEPDEADKFFAQEYVLNEAISKYHKPIISLAHGAVMGGGIGLSGHAHMRICTDDARYGMPESAIGFVCDVGVNALLARSDRAVARAFCLAGQPVGAADAVALNLVDIIVARDRLGALRDRIISHAMANDPLGDIALMIEKEYAMGIALEFVPFVHKQAEAFSLALVADVMGALRQQASSAAASAYLAVINTRCPTSLIAIDLGLKAAFADPNVGRVLERDLILAQYLVRRPDFSEGVRAVLIDKDHAPHWAPDALENVETATIQALVDTHRSK